MNCVCYCFCELFFSEHLYRIFPNWIQFKHSVCVCVCVCSPQNDFSMQFFRRLWKKIAPETDSHLINETNEGKKKTNKLN